MNHADFFATMINPFPTIHPVYLIYFFGGAAFLFLSFSIGTKNMQGSDLRIADSLWLLAIFGFIHGLREWLEIYPLLEGVHLGREEIFAIELISSALLIVSFMFLLQFGLSLAHDTRLKRVKWTVGTYAALCLIWIFFMELRGFSSNLMVVRMQIGARNIFGLIGGFVTAYGMIRYSSSREIKNLHHSIARNFSYAGWAFAGYAFLTTTFFSRIAGAYAPYSKELFRGGAAVFIAYFIIKALNIFDIEMRGKAGDQARRLVQSEKLASLGQLAAGIAHEINNPLTNASLGVQLLRKRLGEPGQAIVEQIKAVEKNIDRAAAIAQELLQFSRRQDMEFCALDINEVIGNALTLMNHRLDRVVVTQDLAPLPEVMGDRGKLEQVFINILSNALEAMPEGGRLSISTVLREGTIEARIADTGAGIAQENVSRVFDPFFTTKEVGSGTGLGLYLCYGIIKQHHGLIELSSAPGRGATVTVKIPSRE